jgi:cytochrome c biogenesis protein CcmG, thiol:disulfide interchange protein DsbE
VIILVILAIFWLPQITSNAAATVNGEAISKTELDRRVAFERLWGDWTGDPAPVSGPEAVQFRASILDTMIQNRVVMQAAKKAGVTATIKEVSDQAATIQQQLGMSDSQMNQALTSAGLTRQTFDNVMREDVIMDRYLRTIVVKGATETEQQDSVRNWYNDALAQARIEKHIDAGGAKVGQLAPDFTLNDLDGKPVRLSDLKGKAVFVNFFATWCQDCRTEMPDIEKTWQAYKDKGVVVLAVDLANQDELGDVNLFVKEFGLTMPVLRDETGSVISQYRVNVIPVSYFVNRQGVLAAVQIGAMSRQTMEQRLTKLLQ